MNTKDIKSSEETITRLRDALAFYADRNRYIFGLIYHDELINDTGGRARQALKENDDDK